MTSTDVETREDSNGIDVFEHGARTLKSLPNVADLESVGSIKTPAGVRRFVSIDGQEHELVARVPKLNERYVRVRDGNNLILAVRVAAGTYSGERVQKLLFKMTDEDGYGFISGLPPRWREGEWLEVSPLHLARPEGLIWWLAPVVWRAEYDGDIRVTGSQVIVRGRARVVERVEGWTERTQRLFAADCAADTLRAFASVMPDNRPRAALKAFRSLANGEASADELDVALADADAAWQQAASMRQETRGRHSIEDAHRAWTAVLMAGAASRDVPAHAGPTGWDGWRVWTTWHRRAVGSSAADPVQRLMDYFGYKVDVSETRWP